MRRSRFALLLVLLLGACAGSGVRDVSGTQLVSGATATSTVTPRATQQAIEASPSPVAGPAPTQTVARATATHAATYTPEPPTPIVETPPAPLPPGASGILIAYGEANLLALAWLDDGGRIVDLSERLQMVASCWDLPQLSPDGAWLAYRPPDPQTRLVLYNLRNHEERTIDGGAYFPFAGVFSASSQRIAYVTMTYLYGGGYQWDIHTRDIDTGIDTRFEGPVVEPGSVLWQEPVPGKPLAWVGDALLLDGFVPPETANWGIRLLDVVRAEYGGAVPLDSYDRLILDPQTIRYLFPEVSPSGQLIAYETWDYDRVPSCRDISIDDGSATGLWMVPVAGGASRMLVDVTAVDGALTGRPLVWSPDGDAILYAQATCADGALPLMAELRTVDLQGSVTHRWPQARIGYDSGCQQALWCSAGQVYYQRGEGELWRLDLETAGTQLVLTSGEIQPIGCLP